MYEFITKNFMGATVTLGLTGLPVVITGEVVASNKEETIALKVGAANKVYIKAELIAFVF